MKTDQLYYLHRNGEQHGPYDSSAFQQMYLQGQILETDLVWSDEMADWQPAMTLFQQHTLPTTPLAPARSRKKWAVTVISGLLLITLGSLTFWGFGSGKSKVSGTYVYKTDTLNSTIDLRVNGVAEMYTKSNMTESSDLLVRNMGKTLQDLMTLKEAKWSLEGNVILIEGVSPNNREPRGRRFEIEPNGDLVELGEKSDYVGNRYVRQ
jgi:hypothetical protein